MDIKIKNIKAATLWAYNAGLRSRYDYTDAMVCNSLLLDFLLDNGLHVHASSKGSEYSRHSTRDIICLDFGFGTRSYEEEIKHIQKQLQSAKELERYEKLLQKAKENKDKYRKLTKDELRIEYYENGVTINYPIYDKRQIIGWEPIKYLMLYRNPSKAKIGACIFIREELYEITREWMTMGLANKMPNHHAKIVELSAYAPLTSSTIEQKFHVKSKDILVLRDQDSVFRTQTKRVVARRDKNGSMHCDVVDGESDVVNTLWDGQALIESSIVPEFCNGMALLRNHFFKACAFRTNIQLFFRDWYGEHYDENLEVEDMFGVPHRIGDIKMITTNNACKWLKFKDLMGDTDKDAYEYWLQRLESDGDYWGIVKTDHPSKLGNVQQMSYQMVNTLPCDTDDIFELADTTIRYVQKIKENDSDFADFLHKNKTAVNHFEMMEALYKHNPDFAKTKWYRTEKSKIIHSYVSRLKQGKIFVGADNLTMCGNPYALLLYSVGCEWSQDPCLQREDGCIQCYTTRFKDGAYLCGIRSPHNSPNNISYLHNRHSTIMDRYFVFSPNIIAVNCIETDIQSRMNGCDFDSDFMFVTDNPVMVRSAEICYRDYPTIVNEIPESGITYDNTKQDYAIMDNRFASSQLSIGESSNLAQLAMTYYWTNPDKALYDVFVVLSVVAQLSIDSIKKVFDIDPMSEINRIRRLPCMTQYKKQDFPLFMRYTRPIQTSKNGKPLPADKVAGQKSKIRNRINQDLMCPMNSLIGVLNTIDRMRRKNPLNTEDFFIKNNSSKANHKQMGKVRKIVEKYTYQIWLISNDALLTSHVKALMIEDVYDEMMNDIRGMTISSKTLNRLIETSLGVGSNSGQNNLRLLATLFQLDKQRFLSNFVSAKNK